MRALVTGASGFLGGCLARMLAERGWQVVVLVRSPLSLGHLDGLGVEIVPGDLADAAALALACAGCTHVFHCAACSTDWAPDARYFETNVVGTRNLLAAAAGVPGLHKFVHVSTTDVYGYPPVAGDEAMPLVETALPYNRTKVQGEREVWAAAANGLPVTVVRPGTIYGPRGKDFTVEMASLLRARLMATVDGGQAAGGFVYVDDVAEAMMAAAECEPAVGQAYNVTDGSGTPWAEYLRVFAAALGVRAPWIDLSFATAMRLAGLMEAPHRWGLPGKPLLTRHAVYLLGRGQEFSPAKAERELRWKASVDVFEGVRRSVAWLQGRV